MKVLTFCEIDRVVCIEGNHIAIAKYSNSQKQYNEEIAVEYDTENEYFVGGLDKNGIYHTIPKDDIFRPMLQL